MEEKGVFGTILCGEITFKITSIELKRGFIILNGESEGPFPAYKGLADVIGADGIALTTFSNNFNNYVDCPAAENGQKGYISLELSFGDIDEDE